MDKEDYVKKAEELLNQPTYRTISSDPTTKCKNKLINLLKSHQNRGWDEWSFIQKALPHRGRVPQILWAPQDSQRRNTIEAHSF